MEGGGGVMRRAMMMMLLGATLIAAGAGAGAAEKRMLVLGLDGMDPDILSELMARGELPNFSKLVAQGDFSPLQTVMPPQSPVAWATVVTGLDPGGTGIFDFLHRNPMRMIPEPSGTRILDAEPLKLGPISLPTHLTLGNCVLPLAGGGIENTRGGVAFWEILDDHGVAATVLKMPSNYPPVETEARTLSGMGTPDIKGTYGIFHAYTDDVALLSANVSGGEVHRVTVRNDRFDATLPGPDDSQHTETPTLEIPFTVFVDPEEDVVRIDIEDRRLLLAKGEWSDWVQISFAVSPCMPFQYINGMVRFHLTQAHPRMKLYASPVNFDPTSPAQMISTPPELAAEIAEAIGLFYTQGMPEDTKALSYGAITDDGFMTQANMILEEEDRMLDWALDGFDEGFLFVYYSAVDQTSHVMWRSSDPQQPMWSRQLQARHGDAIHSMYRGADRALGRAMEAIGDDLLLVISDHGFGPFNREVNLNTWLKDQGYLVLTDDSLESRTQFFNNVDWGRTRAYGVGFNGLYINRRGREKWGIVDPGPESEALLTEITEKLLGMMDHATGQTAVSKMYRSTDIYHGAHVSAAPDLLVGYRRGYRVSESSALGSLPRPVIQDRLDVWSGTHLNEAEAVPGIILANRKLQEGSRGLIDIAPTILDAFGIAPLPEMRGRSLLKE